MIAISIVQGATWAIAALAAGGVIARPWRWPEAVWAVLGAAALVGLALVPWRDAVRAVARGSDVYLFLTGMMLLAELARQQGVFDWLAGIAARHARGSAGRLFALVFAVGTVVTVFLSNDTTAVVLTPAVYAAARAANAEPLPYLFICAFVAMQRVSFCQSPIQPISWSSTGIYRRCTPGWRSSHCPRSSRSGRPTRCSALSNEARCANR
jgi:arsenical pump membrane protein